MFLRTSMISGPQSLTTLSRIVSVSPSIRSHRVYQERPPAHRLWDVAKILSLSCVGRKTPNASKITSIQTSPCWGCTLSPSPTQRSSHSPGRTSCSMEWDARPFSTRGLSCSKAGRTKSFLCTVLRLIR